MAQEFRLIFLKTILACVLFFRLDRNCIKPILRTKKVTLDIFTSGALYFETLKFSVDYLLIVLPIFYF